MLLLAGALTDATLFLGVATVLVAYATWRLGSRASDETRAAWRPVVLVRSREDEMDVKLRLAAGHLTVDVENTGRGPALDVFTEGLAGLERENARVSALAPNERWTCRFTVVGQQDPFMLRINYSDISGRSFSTTVLIALHGGAMIELVNQIVEAHPPLDLPWIRLVPRGRLRRWTFKKVARRRGYRI